MQLPADQLTGATDGALHRKVSTFFFLEMMSMDFQGLRCVLFVGKDLLPCFCVYVSSCLLLYFELFCVDFRPPPHRSSF